MRSCRTHDGEMLAHPVRRKREGCRVRYGRHSRTSPSGNVGNENVVAEVQLRLDQDPPSARTGSRGRAMEHRYEITHDLGTGQRVTTGGMRAHDELAVDDLRDHRVRDSDEVLVGRATLRLHRIASHTTT